MIEVYDFSSHLHPRRFALQRRPPGPPHPCRGCWSPPSPGFGLWQRQPPLEGSTRAQLRPPAVMMMMMMISSFFLFFNRRAPLTLYILSIRVITAVFFISADFHTAPSMCVRHHRADNKVFKISYSVSCPHHSLHSPGRGAALIWDQWCIGELCSIAAAGAPPPQRKTRGARWWGGKFYCS